MSHDFHIATIQPQHVVSIRTESGAQPDEIAAVCAAILPEVLDYVTALGIAPAGPPYVRYFSFDPDSVDLEGGLPVSTPVAGSGRIEPGMLPGGEAAIAWHVGPFDTLSETYNALGAWIREQRREAGPESWEVYWTDPETEPDARKWRTEIVWPLR